MWNDRLRLAERVAADWAALDAGRRSLAAAAMELLDEDPIAGAPLFEPLRGFWSHRTGDLRIVYQIIADGRFVVILSISIGREIATR